jgi:hypothetical protein
MEKMIYHRHYIAVDEQSRISDGWSDGIFPHRETSDAICINEQGGYPFRLTPDGEENPALCSREGIPLYKYEDGSISRRTPEEIESDRAAHTLFPAEQRKEAYNTAQIIPWESGTITVTEAAQLWQYYAAEGNPKAEELTALIAKAKVEIRERYPDN